MSEPFYRVIDVGYQYESKRGGGLSCSICKQKHKFRIDALKCFQRQVNDAVAKGYRPQGGVACIVSRRLVEKTHYDEGSFTQALTMEKKEKKEEEDEEEEDEEEEKE